MWRVPETCPRCGSRLWSDGEWDYCGEIDVCGYSRPAVDAPLRSQKAPDEDPANELGG